MKGRSVPRGLLWWGGVGALALSAVLIVRTADLESIASTLHAARADIGGLLVAVAAYASAFVLRAAA